jgi:hypothetical protein
LADITVRKDEILFGVGEKIFTIDDVNGVLSDFPITLWGGASYRTLSREVLANDADVPSVGDFDSTQFQLTNNKIALKNPSLWETDQKDPPFTTDANGNITCTSTINPLYATNTGTTTLTFNDTASGKQYVNRYPIGANLMLAINNYNAQTGVVACNTSTRDSTNLVVKNNTNPKVILPLAITIDKTLSPIPKPTSMELSAFNEINMTAGTKSASISVKSDGVELCSDSGGAQLSLYDGDVGIDAPNVIINGANLLAWIEAVADNLKIPFE